MNRKNLIIITGPTASGKSALAVELAKLLDTEIISADSRQIYKGIPIVTALPSEAEKQGISHHLMEILPLEAYYSAAKFQEDAENILKSLFSRRDSAIVCGGSMLYIDALVNGIDELPTVPEEIRSELMESWKTNGDDWLLQTLKITDPDYYFKVDLRNLKRVFHAIEISLTCGIPYSSLLTGKQDTGCVNNSHEAGNLSRTRLNGLHESGVNVLKFCLTGPREALFERINIRVLKMIEMGLEDEALAVFNLRHLNSLNTVGLKEMFDYFDGKMTREDAIARIQKNTRVYAKKQMTWHKRDSSITYLDFTEPKDLNFSKILGSL